MNGETKEIITGGLGLVVTAICIIAFLLRSKTKIFVISCVANLINGLNMLWCDQGSASLICFAASLQTALSAYHSIKNNNAPKWEKIVFPVIFTACGLMKFHGALDILPIAASLMFCAAAFQKKLIRFRLFSLANALIWLVYYIIIMNTAGIAQLISACVIVVSMLRDRKKADI